MKEKMETKEEIFDGELCELITTRDRPKVIQSLEGAETEKMIIRTILPLNKNKGRFISTILFLAGSLVCISFGSMVGWPSPNYPILVIPDSPIPITYDNTALIAGMILSGFVIATPISCYLCVGSKLGMILGTAIMIAGWALLAMAYNVLTLCLSRFIVGIGSGISVNKFRAYLREICDETYGGLLQKLVLPMINFGILLTYSIAPFLTFRMLPIALGSIPVIALIAFVFLPDTPFNLYKRKQIDAAMSILKQVHGKENINTQLTRIRNHFDNVPVNKTVLQILKDSETRKSFFLLTALMTYQQFSGGPSLIVYSQIVYTTFNCYYPEACAVVYGFVYLFATCLGTKFIPNVNRKPILLFACFVNMLCAGSLTAYLIVEPEDQNYSFIPFVVMIVYGLVHTAGVMMVTNIIVNDIFPADCRFTMSCYWIMYTFELAVIVTKIFQVLFDRIDMYAPFAMYTSANVIGFFFLFFMDEPRVKLDTKTLDTT